MKVRRNVGRVGFALGLLAVGSTGCIYREVAAIKPRTQSGVSEVIVNEGIDKVDLLLEVDNSNSMRENQEHIMQQFGALIDQLTNPPCVDRNNTSGPTHTCDPNNPDDVPKYPAVSDLHVGVISSDLGTPGATVPGCQPNGGSGDDGVLNPIKNGLAVQRHEPWVSAPMTFPRPMDCSDPNEFPSFISFTSGATSTTAFNHDFLCNAGLYINGCGLEQQLESVWRALIYHDPRDVAGNSDVNAGFLRDDALLAILMLTDEEDGSTRDCRYAENGVDCVDALDVFQPGSTAWSNDNLNMRFYMYQPGDGQDPTWALDRYVDPTHLNRGFMGLKPDHPERILFAAIAGVPLNVPSTGTGADRRILWDQLLGKQGPNGPEDYNGRDTVNAADNPTVNMTAEGLTSMQQANLDPNCPERVVPACRRENTTEPDPANTEYCTTTAQYFAWPSRRVVEIARRFDESPMCGNAPCHNGLVTSICANDYAPAVSSIIEKIQRRLTGRCLPRVLQTQPVAFMCNSGEPGCNCDAMGTCTRTLNNVQCAVRETLPGTGDACDPATGRTNAIDSTTGQEIFEMDAQGGRHRVCEIQAVPTYPSDYFDAAKRNQPCADPAECNMLTVGWYYDTSVDPNNPSCLQRISFTSNATPPSGSTTRLECIQAVGGVDNDAGTGAEAGP